MKFANPTLYDDTTRHRTEYQAEVPGKVTRHRIPGWMSRHLVKRFKTLRGCPDNWSRLQGALRLTGDGLPGWLDHAGYALVGNEPCFVSEPYGLTSRAIASLARFSEQTGLEYEISAASNHYPTRTLRIIFRPPATETSRRRESLEGAA